MTRVAVGAVHHARAHATATDGSIGGGKWGPVSVVRDQRYEFALVQSPVQTLHIYYEPFVRSDHTLRLLASPAFEEYAGGQRDAPCGPALVSGSPASVAASSGRCRIPARDETFGADAAS